MRKKVKWKRLLIGVLCMMLLISNAASVLAEDTDAGNATVSGNDILGNGDTDTSGETETGENGTGNDDEKETDEEQGEETSEKTEQEESIDCEHVYHYISNHDGTHIVTCINCDLEETENCILIEKAEEGQNCEKCGFVTETRDDTEAEDSLQLFSLETAGYDVSAADRTYTAGENITAYYFEADSTLLLEGTGEMAGWSVQTDVPWTGETINAVIIGEGITAIGDHAFSYHPELGSITLPDSLRTIGSHAFCVQDGTYVTEGSLQAVNIPAGVERIGSYAFQGNKLKAVTIPDSVTDIGEYAFAGCCDAESLFIGSGISEIRESTFSNLKSVKILRIPDNIVTIGTSAFHSTGATEIIIADDVRTIERSAFYLCQKAEVITLGNNVETIGQMAFYQCKNLKSLVIPDSVTSIGVEAFKTCNSLSDLTFGSGLKTIGNYAFDGAHVLERVEIPDNVTQIGNGCFNNSRALMDISIGRNVTNIGSRAFYVLNTTKTNVETENKTAIQYNWTDDKREVIFKSKVVFKDRDGNSLKEIVLEHGDTIIDKVPDIEDYEDEGHTYTFAGWEPEITEDSKVTGGAEYIPQYITNAKKYTITFKDHDGTIIKKTELAYGETILDKAPSVSREAEEGKSYIFTGWSPVLDEDTVVTKAEEYTAEYSIEERNYTVTFKDHDGSILVQKKMAQGTLILAVAPVAQRENEGLSSYTFHGWSPELNETDKLTEDVTYTAVYRRKTQTGIQVSHDINIPEGTSIRDSNIIVYPIYKVYDESNKLIEMIRNEDDVIADDDIRFSKDRIERGSNEITVEQISTGLTITAEIFGSYIDGIAVWQPPEELEAGTELKELEVYFTRTIEDKAGFIENSVIDYPPKRVEEYKLNDDDTVTIEEGDNEIRVTEKETGDDHESTVHIKGIPKKPDEDVSGNDPGDGKEDDVSGNDPTDGKEDEVSGKDPSDGKEEDGTSTEDSDQPDKEQDNSSKDTETDTKPSDGTPFYTPVSPDKSEPWVKSENRWEVPEEYEEENENKRSTDIIKVGPVKTGDSFSLWKYVRAAFVSAFVSVFVWLCFTTNLLSYIRLLTGHIFLRGKKRKFHGILTGERNPFIVVDAPEDMTETVQEVISRTEDADACIKELRESGAVTYLPFETKMTLSYKGENSSLKSVSMEADENKLYDTLESLHGRGEVTVRFSNDAVKINIKLNYQV